MVRESPFRSKSSTLQISGHQSSQRNDPVFCQVTQWQKTDYYRAWKLKKRGEKGEREHKEWGKRGERKD